MNRTLVWQLAIRYLRGKRGANAVPILSRISIVAIAVSSGAMIVVFSVVNGLSALSKSLYNDFYPDIRVTVAKGKFFTPDKARPGAIERLPGVVWVSTAIEDQAFAVNNDLQKIVTLKGIDERYFKVNNVGQYIARGDSMVAVGSPQTDTSNGVPNTAVFGEQIVNELGTDINALSYVILNYPDASKSNFAADPGSAIRSLILNPTGIFQSGDDFDNKLVLAPLQLVQELFGQQGKLSSIEIRVEPDAVNKVQAQLKEMLGSDYRVETRYEQNKTLNMVMSGEKWAIYAILVLVLLVASFNMVGALSMLVLEKQKDMAILKAMGAGNGTVRAIFLSEGVLWSVAGGVFGMLLGLSLCLVQQQFGIVKLGASFMVSAFPVELQWQDFLLVFVTTTAVGLLTSWYPALRATRVADPSLKST